MMKEMIVHIFGQYEPIYTELNGVYSIPAGAAGVDWSWIAGVAIFLLAFWGLITLIRMVFSR